jgi:CheY-like chemotaxis protein
VAKILVADDNSNVQKTMALALADLGVEMTSVNNGEAAVRKLADVSPDLILADIFMPVRNGYEVCEYVKKDSRFAHIPVILLVGAFDPLDEREAQRVGADGILKKPFVPPEPLITMVKALLDRSMSERLVAVSSAKPPAAVQVKVAGKGVPEAQALPATAPEEPSPEEFPAPAGRVTFGEGDRPVAFGQLLDSPARPATSGAGVIEPVDLEPVDDEQILTSSRDATLGEPAFWRNESPEVEPEAEQSEDSKDAPSPHTWSQAADSALRQEDAAPLRAVEPLELVRDEQEIGSTSQVDSGPVVLDPAAQAALTVESGRASELAANPLEWLATAPGQHSDTALEPVLGWDETNPTSTPLEPEPFPGRFQVEPAPVSGSHKVEAEPAATGSDTFESTPVVEPAKHSEFAAAARTLSGHEASPKVSAQTPQAAGATQTPEDTARSVTVHKWAEMTDSLEERATEIVSQLVAPGSVPPAEGRPAKQADSQVPSLQPRQTSPPDALPNPKVAIGPVATVHPADSAIQTAPSSAPAVPDPALVEAVVQRVLDKMRPQVVDIITKEFLRPVVQALVQREIEKQ